MECVKGDAQQMTGFQDGQFEVVTLTFALHHIEAPEAALQEIYRVLRSGRKVLIGDWVVREGEPRSGCFRFTVEEIQRMLEKTGFEQVEVEEVEPGFVLVVGSKRVNMASMFDDYTVVSDKAFDAAVEAVRTRAEANGFTVLAIHDLQAVFGAKGFQHDPVAVIEVCHEPFGSRMLAADP